LQPTADIVSVSDAIRSSVTLGSGADGPESYTRMLHELLTIQWRADVKKIAVVFGDAPAHDLNFAGENWGGDPGLDGLANTEDDLDFETVVGQVRAAGITIIAVNSLLQTEDEEDPDFERYYNSAVATFRGMSTGHKDADGTIEAVGTNGQYFELADTTQLPLVTTNLILAESLSVDELTLRVSQGFESWVTMMPEKFQRVGANAAKEFQVTITPPTGTLPGFYSFLLQAVGDGAILGVAPIEVVVPVTDGANDLGFRPNPHGFNFVSGPSTQSWAMFRQFFGRPQVEYNNGHRLHAADRFFSQYYAKAGVNGSTTGLAATSMINFDPDLAQPNAGDYAMPATPNLFSLTQATPAIADAIAFAQGTPLGLEIGFYKANLCAAVQKSPAAMFFSLQFQLQAGSPSILSLFSAEPTTRADLAPERTLLPYRVEQPAANQAFVYVYDPVYPGNDAQKVEFRWTNDRTVDEWRYATPDGVWQGSRQACLLAVTPLSLFTHTGVAWWKAGPSWPPNRLGSAAAAINTGPSQTGDPPAMQMYSVSGPAVLLLADGEGRRLGFAGGAFYDEIAGAAFIPFGGSEAATGGYFYVPRSAGATARLTAAGEGEAALHIFGENYLVEVAAQGLISGTAAAITVDEVGESLTMAGLVNALTGSVGISRLLDDEDRTVRIGNLNLQPGDSASFTFQPAQSLDAQDTLLLQTDNGANQALSLSVQRTGNAVGYTVFGAADLPLLSDSALAVQIDDWANLAQVTLVETDAAGNVGAPQTVADAAVPLNLAFETPTHTLVDKGAELELVLVVRDQLGAYVADGTTVTLTSTLGTLAQTVVQTMGGRAGATLTHNGVRGQAIVSGQAGAAQGSLAIDFLVTPVPTLIQPSAAKLELSKPGEQVQITVAITDQFGVAMPDGTIVTFTTTLGSLAPTTLSTVDGRATTTLTHNGTVGAALVTAQAGDVQATLMITLRAPAALPEEEEPERGFTHKGYLPLVQR
jgi:hypothetical protein